MKFSHKQPRMTTSVAERVNIALDAGCTCGGETCRLVRRLIGGNVTIHMQCDLCGRSVCGSLKRDGFPFWQDHAEWSEAIREAYDANRDPGRAERAVAFAEARDDYRNNFLRSDEWRDLRQKVMQRANYVCEACLANRATDVHHTRYGIDCLPPAWDLRAVCRPCHEKIHVGKSQ